jgi:hypothetical protein
VRRPIGAAQRGAGARTPWKRAGTEDVEGSDGGIDVKQVAAAESFVAAGAWVGHVVLAETTWVLDAVYNLGPPEIAMAVEMLLNHQRLAIADAVAAALETVPQKPTRELLGLPSPTSTVLGSEC